jgi:thiamine kinase-like enzyme
LINLGQLREALRSHLQTHARCNNTDTVELLAHGEANVIFRLGCDRLVRVAVNTPNQRFGGDFRRVTAFEGAILTYLQGTGLGHDLLDAHYIPTQDFPYTYLITNYLPGTPVDYSRPHLARCAQTLAQLHRLPWVTGYQDWQRLMPTVPRISQPLEVFFSEAQAYAQPYLESPDADSQVVAMLTQLLEIAAVRLDQQEQLTQYPYECLVHSDHTYENWVVADHQAYLIDWEWAEIGSPAGDLGHFLSPVTIHRRYGYRLPPADKQFFLDTYYAALESPQLAQTLRVHYSVFGPFPAVRSLCWTAGYWVTARRWYAGAVAESASAVERLRRLQESQQAFPELWAAVMAWLEETP